jgi:hypothetical protein
MTPMLPAHVQAVQETGESTVSAEIFQGSLCHRGCRSMSVSCAVTAVLHQNRVCTEGHCEAGSYDGLLDA